MYLQSVYRDEIFTLTGPDAGNGNWIDYASSDPGSRVHLHHDTATHRFVLVDADGVEFSFNDYSSVYTTAQQGAFVGRSPPGGEANAVVDSYDSGGNLEKEDTADNSGVSKTN